MKDTFKTGQKVQITSDNESYIDFIDKPLVISDVFRSSKDHPGFDESAGSNLYEFYNVDGVEVPFALYDWEIELI